MLAKVGWGTSSTVWLARDTQRWWWQSNRYVVLKVIASPYIDRDAAKHELNIDRRLKTNPSHNGFLFVRTTLDSCEATGPDDRHFCLVYEPLREPLWIFQRRWEDGKLPPSIVKVYTRFLLQGLNYLHSECRVIHTDLKPDNIMMRFEDPSVIEDFVQKEVENPMPRKIKDSRSIYQSHNDFGRLKSLRVLPMIADFGLAELGDGPEPLRHPIQPPLYHAPEVLLGTGWTYSADIWNLGVLIWNLMENKDLFRHIRSSQGAYDPRAHLAEMIALLGPPPKTLINREERWSEVKWSHAVPNAEGELCQTAREYYGGPFFNSEGEFLYKDPIPNNFNLPDSVLSLKGEDKQRFLDFNPGQKLSGSDHKLGSNGEPSLNCRVQESEAESEGARLLPRMRHPYS
ncbi:MAG: hypothetical protein FRX48_01480 [Lasallia pustulata]|uniref:non-specific serine/threonine protein kinase n=1 Tax=Lasallia pustulata TaxID=136370 RepID=A0A5M8Q0G4_9LECA|nr:MAG: hypothetical protein FRX48_01480 [Lasallia pustulata]